MKVKINSWHSMATWKWDIQNQENCAICQFRFEDPCPKCQIPGDECAPTQGRCSHHFHMHCILKWIDQGFSDCPLDRAKWVVKS